MSQVSVEDQQRQIVCPWPTVAAQVNARLDTYKVLPLSNQESFLLYIVILSLYDEGVRPTYPEVHNKLKEHNASEELLHKFVVCYLLQIEWYKVCRGTCEVLPTGNARELTQSFQLLSDKTRTPLSARTTKRASPLNDITVYFRCDPVWWHGWVDLRDPINRYPAQVWVDFLEFLRASTLDSAATAPKTSETLSFEHTRYALAKSIKKIGPPSIRQLRLGDIAHLIQLALQHGVLCYESTTIQPCWTSHTLASVRPVRLNWDALPAALAETLTSCQQVEVASPVAVSPIFKKSSPKSVCDLSTEASSTCHSSLLDLQDDCPDDALQDSTKRPILSIAELRSILPEWLKRQEGGRILLSQLRALLEAEYGLVLQPLAFGYNKLSDLISDHLKDICTLTRHRSRHVYIEAVRADVSSLSSSPRTKMRRNLSALAAEHLSAISDLWERSSSIDEDWSVDDLYRLDGIMQERNGLFPSSRQALSKRYRVPDPDT